MPRTFLADLVDPQVLGDMVEADLGFAMRFAPLATIDSTLVGQAGSKVTIPVWGPKGEAKLIPEGEAIEYQKLSTSMKTFTIEKVASGYEISDEAVLSGYGNPIGKMQEYITAEIAEYFDNSALDAIKTTPLTVVSSGWGPTLVEAIEDAFNVEDGETGVIFMCRKDFTKHRREMGLDWSKASEIVDTARIKGANGEALGWEVVVSNKIGLGKPIAVKPGAITTYLKRGVQAEGGYPAGRDIDRKLTKYNADKHGKTYLTDQSKAIKVTVTIPEPPVTP